MQLDSNTPWLARLQAVECRDSSYGAQDPALVFARAQGSTVFDVAGNEYIDLCAGFGVMALGHNDPVVLYGMRKYLMDETTQPGVVHGMGDVYPSQPKVELLETLRSVLPAALTKGALALGGGQAVELALKTAMLATKKTGFIVFDGSYHGLDLGVLPLTSRQDFKQPFLGWLHPEHVRSLPYGCDEQQLVKAIQALDAAGPGAAAVVVEPIQGRAGVRLPPKDWLASLRRVCDAHGVLLIFDEIFTGIGRTGKWSHAAKVPCDLICLGKAIGGGMPLSACFGTEAVMAAWPQNTGEAIHTGTFFGHPFSCFVGALTISEIRRRDLVARSKQVGAWWREHLQSELAALPLVKEIRGQGLMMNIELQTAGAGAQLMGDLRRLRVIALPSGPHGECLSFTPALNIAEELLKEATQGLKTAIANFAAKS